MVVEKPRAKPVRVHPDEAMAEIKKIWGRVSQTSKVPGMQADDGLLLRNALRHCGKEIDALLAKHGITAPSAGEGEMRERFIDFLGSAATALARRSKQIRDRPIEKPEITPRERQDRPVINAGLTLFAALNELDDDSRAALFEESCFPLDWGGLGNPHIEKLAKRFDARGVQNAVELWLALLARDEATPREPWLRVENLAPAFVEAAAEFWEGPPVSRQITTGKQSGSFEPFCSEVNTQFLIGLPREQILSGVQVLLRHRRKGAMPEQSISKELQDAATRANAVFKRIADQTS